MDKDKRKIRESIETGRTCLGVEFGSTRIKAVLAAYRSNHREGETLEKYLANKVFSTMDVHVLAPKEEDVAGFAKFIERYKAALKAERTAVEVL